MEPQPQPQPLFAVNQRVSFERGNGARRQKGRVHAFADASAGGVFRYVVRTKDESSTVKYMVWEEPFLKAYKSSNRDSTSNKKHKKYTGRKRGNEETASREVGKNRSGLSADDRSNARAEKEEATASSDTVSNGSVFVALQENLNGTGFEEEQEGEQEDEQHKPGKRRRLEEVIANSAISSSLEHLSAQAATLPDVHDKCREKVLREKPSNDKEKRIKSKQKRSIANESSADDSPVGSSSDGVHAVEVDGISFIESSSEIFVTSNAVDDQDALESFNKKQPAGNADEPAPSERVRPAASFAAGAGAAAAASVLPVEHASLNRLLKKVTSACGDDVRLKRTTEAMVVAFDALKQVETEVGTSGVWHRDNYSLLHELGTNLRESLNEVVGEQRKTLDILLAEFNKRAASLTTSLNLQSSIGDVANRELETLTSEIKMSLTKLTTFSAGKELFRSFLDSVHASHNRSFLLRLRDLLASAVSLHEAVAHTYDIIVNTRKDDELIEGTAAYNKRFPNTLIRRSAVEAHELLNQMVAIVRTHERGVFFSPDEKSTLTKIMDFEKAQVETLTSEVESFVRARPKFSRNSDIDLKNADDSTAVGTDMACGQCRTNSVTKLNESRFSVICESCRCYLQASFISLLENISQARDRAACAALVRVLADDHPLYAALQDFLLPATHTVYGLTQQHRERYRSLIKMEISLSTLLAESMTSVKRNVGSPSDTSALHIIEKVRRMFGNAKIFAGPRSHYIEQTVKPLEREIDKLYQSAMDAELKLSTLPERAPETSTSAGTTDSRSGHTQTNQAEDFPAENVDGRTSSFKSGPLPIPTKSLADNDAILARTSALISQQAVILAQQQRMLTSLQEQITTLAHRYVAACDAVHSIEQSAIERRQLVQTDLDLMRDSLRDEVLVAKRTIAQEFDSVRSTAQSHFTIEIERAKASALADFQASCHVSARRANYEFGASLQRAQNQPLPYEAASKPASPSSFGRGVQHASKNRFGLNLDIASPPADASLSRSFQLRNRSQAARSPSELAALNHGLENSIPFTLQSAVRSESTSAQQSQQQLRSNSRKNSGHVNAGSSHEPSIMRSWHSKTATSSGWSLDALATTPAIGRNQSAFDYGTSGAPPDLRTVVKEEAPFIPQQPESIIRPSAVATTSVTDREFAHVCGVEVTPVMSVATPNAGSASSTLVSSLCADSPLPATAVASTQTALASHSASSAEKSNDSAHKKSGSTPLVGISSTDASSAGNQPECSSGDDSDDLTRHSSLRTEKLDMPDEQARLATFYQRNGPAGTHPYPWPHTHPSAEECAKAGLVFSPSPKKRDRCSCPCCDVSLYDWSPEDDPVEAHREFGKADCWLLPSHS